MTYRQLDIVSLLISILMHIGTIGLALTIAPIFLLVYAVIYALGFYTAYKLINQLADEYIVLKTFCWTILLIQYMLSILVLTFVNIKE